MRESFEELEEAIASMREQAIEIRRAGGLEPIKVLRAFDPQDLVAGRLEISSGGILHGGRDAGVDVMGDGRVVPFRGGVRRTELPTRDGGDEFDAVREELL